MSKFNRAVIFTNGQAEHPEELTLFPGDFLLAVDGGMKYTQALGLIPQLWVGDLDSADPEHVDQACAQGIEILRYAPAKDQTDLELALTEVIKRGFKQIMIAFALGGRVDHLLANLALLGRADLQSIDTRLDDGITEVLLVKDQLNLAVKPGDFLSLIPWQGDAQGVSTSGLQYPLKYETLYAYQGRGVSNVCTAERVIISCRAGALLVVHTRNNFQKKETE